MSNPKEAQFAGWAKAVLDAIEQNAGWAEYSPPPGRYVIGSVEWEKSVQQIIARGGYALVEHMADHLTDNSADYFRMIESIPDLPVLPKE